MTVLWVKATQTAEEPPLSTAICRICSETELRFSLLAELQIIYCVTVRNKADSVRRCDETTFDLEDL